MSFPSSTLNCTTILPVPTFQWEAIGSLELRFVLALSSFSDAGSNRTGADVSAKSNIF